MKPVAHGCNAMCQKLYKRTCLGFINSITDVQIAVSNKKVTNYIQTPFILQLIKAVEVWTLDFIISLVGFICHHVLFTLLSSCSQLDYNQGDIFGFERANVLKKSFLFLQTISFHKRDKVKSFSMFNASSNR